MGQVSEQVNQKAFGWAARDPSVVFSPFTFSRRAMGENDVTFKVLYCGICHSDLHMAKNELGEFCTYPLVPGHEIVGIVTKIGSKVEKFKIGDKVGVGCLVGCCHSCENCVNNLENYCPKMIPTQGAKYYDGTTTQGGYFDIMVANEHFVVYIPNDLPLDASAPLLCVGISVYSPLRFYELDKPGCYKHNGWYHHTVAAPHALEPLIGLLKTNGKLVLIGCLEKPLELPVFPLLMGRRIVGGSACGGIKETQKMLYFAAEQSMTADIEVIAMDYVNTAMDCLAKGDAALSTMDGIIDTEKPPGLLVFPLLMGRKMVGGYASGGMTETQEMLYFASQHNIAAYIDVISMEYVNTAMDRLAKGDIRY
ncbi:hypothetical protein Patl1_28370 [Pistacia atlantica]|uniref:Uncharacterized protein n=1 Tax=Pistacia atlantica TaxID=434234 RepID=A0ACC1BC40_9ROSI|nr:hypothetical protein Patl1_28370 [Pistacia atlantica]